MNKTTTILLLSMLPFLQMQALEFTVDNFTYVADEGSSNATLKKYVIRPTGALTIPSEVFYEGTNYSVTAIRSSAFSNCSDLTGTLTIPKSVTYIGFDAFFGCSGFTGALIIPASVTYIGESAFASCIGFTGALTIPASVTFIGENAFINCIGFTGALTIPASVISIENGAFTSCLGFTHIEVDPNNPNYSTVDGILYNKDQTTLHTCLSGKKGTISIPSSVTAIENSAFYQCIGLTGALTIPASVMAIGYDAFYGCTGFTGALTIPESVTTIGRYAFYNCNKLTTVVNYRNAPLTIHPETFLRLSATCILKVPTGSKAAYEAADGWKEFRIIEEFNPASVETIGGESKRFWIEGNRIRLSNSEAVLRIELYNADGQLIGQTTTVPDSHRGIVMIKLFYRDGSVSNSKVICG